MEVEMALPSPKTPSTKRFLHTASPSIVVHRTPRSEGFRRRKDALDSPYTLDDNSRVSESVWTSDTPPMSSSPAQVPTPFREILRNPSTGSKASPLAISEKRFYNTSANRKSLLPLFKRSVTLETRNTLDKHPVKEPSLKRKRSKSLDHRKSSEPGKLNKNICHNIKRPKVMKPQKDLSQLHAGVESQDLKDVTSKSNDIPTEIGFACKLTTINKNTKPKFTEKKISVNVNRMVRVNMQGGELRFTKHIMSPKKPLTPTEAEQMDLADDASDACEDWLHSKVDCIISNLNKENSLSADVPAMNASENCTSLSNPTAQLSDAFCELGVKELEKSLPQVRNDIQCIGFEVDSNVCHGEVHTSALLAENETHIFSDQSSTEDASDKLFPVFCKTPKVKNGAAQKKNTPISCRKFSTKSDDGLEQLIIDAGQKSLGPSNCPECGFYYQTGDPDDERMHIMYHESAKPIVKHTGWRWERVALKFPDARVVHVCPGDPKPWWSKVELVLEKANQDLGIAFCNKLPKDAHAYLYVSNMLILGCVIAEPVRIAYRMLESDKKELEKLKEPGDDIAIESPSFCSNTPVRGSRCGINRIWICASERRKGIATKLLDTVRATFVYGHILKLNEIAFSDPTPMGMAFAMNYTKIPNFLVYRTSRD